MHTVVQARNERILGVRNTEYSSTWGSAWIDLKVARKFQKGDHLQITLRDDGAKRILVRLLQKGHKADECIDIVGENKILTVPSSRIVDFTLDKDYPETVQISVHGNPNPWQNCFGINYLGEDNGPALLLSVELVPSVSKDPN
jgi:hypothetical protein